MRFGVVLPSYCYNEYRAMLAEDCFETLVNTRWQYPEGAVESVKPKLYLMPKSTERFKYPVEELGKCFEVVVEENPSHINSTEQSLAYTTMKVLEDPTVTHVVWMGDDALFSPHWLIKLWHLIDRHPDAKAWSVYRSAHVRFHETLEERAGDVLVKSLCGHCMTFTREEWAAWGVSWEQGNRWHSAVGGTTLDLYHPQVRPGERWCTGQSYVEHAGREGINCRTGIPEYAQFFAGVEA